MSTHSLLAKLRSLQQSRQAVQFVSSIAASVMAAGTIAMLQPARADMTTVRQPLSLSSTIDIATQ